MSQVDLSYLRQWIGKEYASSDVLSVRQAHLMAATLGMPKESLLAGSALPPLWHWIFFLEGLSPADLGPDGHPARGGFLPPVPLSNRMWAGGSLTFHTALPLGAIVEKRSRIIEVEQKQGRSGELVFVKVQHDVLHAGNIALREIHDIVYKEPGQFKGSSRTPSEQAKADHAKSFTPDSTTLFRYSALTFNGHRIHYDVDYCRNVEGYHNLVIHGPLNATILAGFAEEILARPLKSFQYRGLQPSLLGDVLSVNAVRDGDELKLWVSLPDGSISMTATAK